MTLGFWGQQTFHGLTWCKVWQSLFSMLDVYIKWIILHLLHYSIDLHDHWPWLRLREQWLCWWDTGSAELWPSFQWPDQQSWACTNGRASGRRRAADKGLIPAAVGWHTPTSQRNDSFCQSQTPAGDERAFNHTQTKMPEESLPTPACNDMFYKHCLEIDSECFLVLC